MSQFIPKMQNATFNDVAIVSLKGSAYGIQFWYMTKDEAINVMKSSNLNEKCGLLLSIYIYIYIYIYLLKNRHNLLKVQICLFFLKKI